MKPHTNVFIEYLGWYGALAIVGGYGLYSFGILGAENIWYHFLNFTGAAGIIAVCAHKKTWQPLIVNVMWLGIAAYSLYVYVQ